DPGEPGPPCQAIGKQARQRIKSFDAGGDDAPCPDGQGYGEKVKLVELFENLENQQARGDIGGDEPQLDPLAKFPPGIGEMREVGSIRVLLVLGLPAPRIFQPEGQYGSDQ